MTVLFSKKTLRGKSFKVNRLEKENKEQRNEVEELNGQIERLHADMQKMKDNHTKEMNRANEQH